MCFLRKLAIRVGAIAVFHIRALFGLVLASSVPQLLSLTYDPLLKQTYMVSINTIFSLAILSASAWV